MLKQFNLHHRVLYVLGGVMLCALLIGVLVSQVSAMSPMIAQPTKEQSNVHEQLDGWGYVAATDGNQTSVIVLYEELTQSGVKAFDEANRRLANQVAGPVSVSVVFQRPLSVDEFKELVQQTKLSIQSYTMRAVDVAGTRITIDGAPDGNTLVPQGMLERMLSHAKDDFSGFTFKGIITVEATANPAQLRKLLADERVFTTDVSRAVATEHARAKLAAHNPNVAQLPTSSRLATPLYWVMEDVGLAGK